MAAPEGAYDLVVIGTGWYGLGSAKEYIQLHPHEKILILESGQYCGGTWSKDRLYPGLHSNNLWGSYEFPDFPMTEEEYGVREGQHVPADVLHEYLTDFAKHFGILERTRFNTRVNVVEAANDGWVLHTTGSEPIRTSKLIVATGLTSTPNLPTYPGSETFGPPLFHAKDFYKRAKILETCDRAVVVGAGKSAYDIAYAFATAKATVDLLIRPTGQGPVWLCPPYVTPLKRKLEELIATRFFSWMSPCPWQWDDGHTWAHWFLQGTRIGRIIVNKFWNIISDEVVDTFGFNKDKELAKLKPWNIAKWTGSAVGIHNFPTNFFDLVKQGRIRVHIAEIDRLEGTTVHLSNGERLETDAVICATGWKKASELKFVGFDTGLAQSPAEVQRLSKIADKHVLEMFPLLRDQPKFEVDVRPADPMRNYRFIVPSKAIFKRNIAFAGMVSAVTTAIFSTVQGLWISAYFDGKLQRVPETDDEVLQEIMLHTQFEKWRYPCGYGASLPDFAFDCILYADMLVNDLGLNCHRKGTYIREVFEAYKPRDYKGLSQEWAEKYGREE
ncbi:hypothetical protein LTR05_002063 [Lithohypha guttulata]|uniref:Flavin-containing monooxygenase n=1 Tax=Lithohypha guttulata TaxID=1690604 RepID=A0AAN7T3L8_9EURO|nr:hypothetical protein LTR05_002063 [Lithohypha guttulata]